MDIYVQSCGLHPKQDYCWRKIIQTENQLQDNPPLLIQVKDRNDREGLITDFYYSETPSIVLARGNHKSILVITALQASDRSKIYGRAIRNSIAIITPDTQLLQKIAERASHYWDDFTEQIDRAVKFDEQSGFKVDLTQIKSCIDKIRDSTASDKLTNIIQITDLEIASEELKKKNRQKMILLQLIVTIALILMIVFFWAKRVH